MANPAEVEVRIHDQVARITISDAKGMNLMNTPTMERIIAIGEELKANDDLRAVVLTGGGDKSFIGGADITELVTLNAESGLAFITKVHQVCHLFRALPVPTIARINGYCLGAGMEVAAACDLRIGAEESSYGMPEVQLGVPSVVEAALLPSLIGWGNTRDILLTGRVFGAEEARRMGFLQKTAPRSGLDDALQEWIEPILSAEPLALRAQKQLIESWLESGVAAGVQAGIDAFSRSFHTPAPTERMQAFIDRPRKK